jgi:hypothetical protein
MIGSLLPKGAGTKVEPIPTAAVPGPMLYSADALRTVGAITDWLGCELRRRALDIARSEGRTMVTGDDVWSAYDRIAWSGDGRASGEAMTNQI